MISSTSTNKLGGALVSYVDSWCLRNYVFGLECGRDLHVELCHSLVVYVRVGVVRDPNVTDTAQVLAITRY